LLLSASPRQGGVQIRVLGIGRAGLTLTKAAAYWRTLDDEKITEGKLSLHKMKGRKIKKGRIYCPLPVICGFSNIFS
jgi:hypothetical protein